MDLPDHILMEICAMLSVKSICRSKCVCKYWRDTITDINFTKLHYERAPICGLFRRGYSNLMSLSLFEIERGSYFNNRGNLNLDTIFKVPKLVENSCMDILNSCNGFLCLCLKRIYITYSIVIYNPVTGEYSILPIPEDVKKFGTTVLGLGFCPTSKLYKVLLTATNKIICDCRSNSSACRERMAFVYTLGLGGGWRKIKKVPCFYCPVILNSVFLNGVLHWVVQTSSLESTAIMSFDLEGEKFCYLPTPDLYLRSLPTYLRALGLRIELNLNLRIIRGQLYLIDNMYAPSIKFELWVLKDYGVGNSWTKEHLIDVFSFGESWSPGLCQSIHFANSWDFLFYFMKEKIIYFIDRNKDMRCLKIGDTRPKFGVEAYVPSFYSLKDIMAGSLEVLNVRSRYDYMNFFPERGDCGIVDPSVVGGLATADPTLNGLCVWQSNV